jgi:prolyl-tRNA synthetase
MERLEMYKRCYEELLAVPVIPGMKSDNEKFAGMSKGRMPIRCLFHSVGAEYTTTLELYLDGAQKALQGATSHHLGQKFSKIFQIEYLSKKHHMKEFAWQNSWGFTTRSVCFFCLIYPLLTVRLEQ